MNACEGSRLLLTFLFPAINMVFLPWREHGTRTRVHGRPMRVSGNSDTAQGIERKRFIFILPSPTKNDERKKRGENDDFQHFHFRKKKKNCYAKIEKKKSEFGNGRVGYPINTCQVMIPAMVEKTKR